MTNPEEVAQADCEECEICKKPATTNYAWTSPSNNSDKEGVLCEKCADELDAECVDCEMYMEKNGSNCDTHAGQRADALYEAYKENGQPKHS